jgi:outer membrane immunogenic protein
MRPSLLLFSVSAVVLGMTAAAQGADFPAKAPIYKAPAVVESWGGFYVGGGIGFRSSESRVNLDSATDTTSPAVLQNRFVAANCLAGLPCVTNHPFNGTAFRGTLYAGYNWQIGRAVVGLEGDAGFADQTTTVAGGAYPATPFAAGGSPSNSFALRTTWDASLRARGGYLVDPSVLLYGTAGPSWIHFETTSNCSTLLSADGACAPGGFPVLAPPSITNSHTQLGYTVGGGIETMLWPNWIARAEYRFSDYGRVSNTDVRSSPLGVQTATYDTTLRTHTATFGLAYKFGNAGSMAAYAAMPPVAAPATSWTGVHVGVAAGIRANRTTGTIDQATSAFPGGFPPFNPLAICPCSVSNDFDTTSARISPYLGYDWQINPKWVVGLEGDFGFADASGTHSGNYLPGVAAFGASNGLNDSYSIRTKWDASIRGRVGYLVNPSFLAYLTGGGTWMSVEETSKCDTAIQALAPAPGFAGAEIGNCTAGLRTPAVISQSTVKSGFTVGGGGEMKLWSNWMLRGEYRFSDFGHARFSDSRTCAGSATISGPSGTTTVNCFQTDTSIHSLRLQSHTAMFGLAYKFD